jgi:hypothetical protein
VSRCYGKPEIKIEKENLICGTQALVFKQEILGRTNDLLSLIRNRPYRKRKIRGYTDRHIHSKVVEYASFYFFKVRKENNVSWVPCHYDMERPQVVDGGDALQVWRVTANILNKQSRTTDNGRSSSLGVGRGANNSSP